MGEFIPDYLLREQAAVGALALFGVLLHHRRGRRV